MALKHAGLTFKATLSDANRLFHRGQKVLTRMEQNGIKIDTKYLKRIGKETESKIATKTEKLLGKHKKVVRLWKRRFGPKTNFDSHPQLGQVFFGDLKYPYPVKEKTALSGRWKTDEATLAKIDHPFVQDLFEIKKLQKALGTYIKGISKEVTLDGYLHTSYNLHLVDTYRSSSSLPNLQNIPVRNKMIMELIRRMFVSRFKNGRLIEVDFSILEVMVAACYHKDPTMLRFIREGVNFHRMFAAKLFRCKESQVSKDTRYAAKNMFVFPEFYGSYYIDCATNLFEAMKKLKLRILKEDGSEGMKMEKWIKRQGIKSLGLCNPETPPRAGTFEHHVAKVEKEMWEKTFPVYAAWKKKWYDAYLATGVIPFFTGFRVESLHKRNDVINYPVQGAAFHLLLWCLIRIQHELRSRKMKSLLIGQTHDSALGDVYPGEEQEFLDICYRVMEKEMPKAFDWIIVPMKTEAEVTPRGGSLADKKVWIKKDDRWKVAL